LKSGNPTNQTGGHAPTELEYEEITEFPTDFHQQTEEVFKRVGDFDYEKHSAPMNSQWPKLGPFKFTDGSVYEG